MELQFFIRGFRYLVLALSSAAFAWSVSDLLSSYLDLDIIRSMLSVAALMAVASQWYFCRVFPPAHVNSADYACNTITLVGVVSALYAFSLSYYDNLYMKDREILTNFVAGASSAADLYVRRFCLNADGTPKANNPDVTATCPLTQKIEGFLKDDQYMTHDAISTFLEANPIDNNLKGRVKRSDQNDLTSSIASPDAPVEIAEFNVIYNYLEDIEELSRDAEKWREKRRNLPFVHFFETSRSRLQSIWVLFIAIMMKLGLVLAKQRAS
jgi:hypothetical protein